MSSKFIYTFAIEYTHLNKELFDIIYARSSMIALKQLYAKLGKKRIKIVSIKMINL